MDPNQQIKLAGNWYRSNVRLRVYRWTRDSLDSIHAGGAFKSYLIWNHSNKSNGLGTGTEVNVRLEVGWT